MTAAIQMAAQSPGAVERSHTTQAHGQRKLLADLFSTMTAIDAEGARMSMKAWAKFLTNGSTREHSTVFTSLEEYLRYRKEDVGQMYDSSMLWYVDGLVY